MINVYITRGGNMHYRNYWYKKNRYWLACMSNKWSKTELVTAFNFNTTPIKVFFFFPKGYSVLLP